MINAVGGFIDNRTVNETETGLDLLGGLDVNQGGKGSKGGIVMKRKSDSQHSEKGAAMVEYAVLVALVLCMCMVSVTTIGERADFGFSEVVNAMGQGQN